MGLNLDADHVAFAALRKFDGQRRRYLYAHEAGQIAGRAGRFRNNGTFGTTGKCLPFDEDMVLRITNHQYDSVKTAEWRNSKLDFASLEALQDSLAAPSGSRYLRRIAPALDELTLERLIKVHDIEGEIEGKNDLTQLWMSAKYPISAALG